MAKPKKTTTATATSSPSEEVAATSDSHAITAQSQEIPAVVSALTNDSAPGWNANASDDSQNPQAEQPQQEQAPEQQQQQYKLYKSTRLKGYITLALASAINYHSAKESGDSSNTAVSASEPQQRYAQSVALVTIVLSLLTILAHLDRFTPLRKFWNRPGLFGPKSKFELGLTLFFFTWWFIATWKQTSVRGIAGDGKGQYNLYFSTWACLWTSVWTLERWMVAYGLSSFKSFLASWPNRAPGWIAMWILAFADMLCFLDLFLNWEEASTDNEALEQLFSEVTTTTWEWLLFVSAFTIPCAAGFALVEIFREHKPNEDPHTKSEWEIILEGFVLLSLVLSWIPTVIVATTPGGVASLVGNAYFFTWATCVFVMETSVWWIHDWRKRIHLLLQQQKKEYQRIQDEVLAKSRAAAEEQDQFPPEEIHQLGWRQEESPAVQETDDLANHIIYEDGDEDNDYGSVYSDLDGVIPDVVGT